VGLFVGTRLSFRFGENPLVFEWGLHGFGVGALDPQGKSNLMLTCGGASMVIPKNCI